MNIVGRKNIYFLISLLVLIPGIISLFVWGLKLSIEFTGGSRVTLVYEKTVEPQNISYLKSIFEKEKIHIASLQQGDNKIIVRTNSLSQDQNKKIGDVFKNNSNNFKVENFETVGPVISGETTQNAFKAVLVASALIVLYIAWSFRKVPKPASSLRFGVCAIIAVLHDVLVVVGIFSLLGHFSNVEIDSMFVTAILTIIGFSVHDTIVVFDRIRENLRRMPNEQFGSVVNESILQTFTRSLNTSFTVILVLFTLLLFGGASIKWFTIALLVGIISGTYSSIFNAAPLLVLWEEWSRKRKNQ